MAWSIAPGRWPSERTVRSVAEAGEVGSRVAPDVVGVPGQSLLLLRRRARFFASHRAGPASGSDALPVAMVGDSPLIFKR